MNPINKSMKNVKILTSEYLIYFPKIQESKFFSFINYFLRLHFELKSKDKTNYHWLPPSSLLINPDSGIDNYFVEEICKTIEEEKIDVIGVSVYVWNKTYFNVLCAEIKKKFPNIIIVAGGPELDAHKNNKFFDKNPWYDYVIYGDGESAFTNLLDHLAGIDTELHNVVAKDGTIYPHQVFTDKSVLKESPYLTYKDEIKQVLTDFKTRYKNKFNRTPEMIAVWETTKGCPYACSFCDWSSGLHNKVRFWGKQIKIANNISPTPVVEKPYFQSELDFFAECRFDMIQWTNPNVGLSHEDEDIVDYWCNMKKTNPHTPISFILQLSKIKKDVTHRLYKKMIAAGLEKRLKFDVQDLDPVVIQNLDRPEIPWPEHKKMIKEFVDEFPDVAGNYKSKINFIWGLPGQTLKHFDYNLTETNSLGFQTHFFYFEILPNSPAAVPEYIEKYKIHSEEVYVTHLQIPYNTTVLNEEVLNTYFTKTNLVTSTYSMSKKEWYTGIVKNYIYKYYFNTVIRNKAEVLLENFHLYHDIVDDMYDHFLNNNIIAIHASHLFNSGLYKNYKDRIQKITYELYKVK